MNMVHRAMMVSAQFAPLARALSEAFEPVSGAGMFKTPVYNQSGTITHYASNGLIQEEYAELLDDSTGNKLWAAIQQAGAQASESAVKAMMASSIVRSDCNVLDIVAEMGLAGHTDPNSPGIL